MVSRGEDFLHKYFGDEGTSSNSQCFQGQTHWKEPVSDEQ